MEILPVISQSDAVKFIKNSGGKVFALRFWKRTDHSLRTMNARIGVKSYLRGGERAYDFEEKGLIPVFDMSAVAFRCVPIDTLEEIEIKGQWFSVRK